MALQSSIRQYYYRHSYVARYAVQPESHMPLAWRPLVAGAAKGSAGSALCRSQPAIETQLILQDLHANVRRTPKTTLPKSNVEPQREDIRAHRAACPRTAA